jgi:hypothetical protein
MAGDTTNPRVWLNGDVYTSPVGTAAPTTVTAAWASPWSPVGLLSEDGLVESRSQTSTDFYAWGGILIRTVRSKKTRSFKVTCLEDNDDVFGLVNPGSTAATATGLTTRTVKTPGSDIRAFGIEIADGTTIKRRSIPRAEVVDVSDVTFADASVTGFELTVNVYPASDGTLYVDLTNDPAAAVS